jgi:hypothetical protein
VSEYSLLLAFFLGGWAVGEQLLVWFSKYRATVLGIQFGSTKLGAHSNSDSGRRTRAHLRLFT